jgi:hypothetical protein
MIVCVPFAGHYYMPRHPRCTGGLDYASVIARKGPPVRSPWDNKCMCCRKIVGVLLLEVEGRGPDIRATSSTGCGDEEPIVTLEVPVDQVRKKLDELRPSPTMEELYREGGWNAIGDFIAVHRRLQELRPMINFAAEVLSILSYP